MDPFAVLFFAFFALFCGYSFLNYSRNAVIGLVRIARIAGSRQAETAAIPRIITASESAIGSLAEMPYNAPSMNRTRSKAAIGANTTVFSLIDAVIFNALPYPQPKPRMSTAVRVNPGDLSSSRNV